MNTKNNTSQIKQDTITFQPTSRNRRMLDQAMGIRRTKAGKIMGRKPRHGDQTKILNQACDKFLPIILQERKEKAGASGQSI